MRKYTQLCLATFCFISSVSAFADNYKGEVTPLIPVSIPTFAGGFEFTLGALYMTPDTSGTDYLGVTRFQDAGTNVIFDRVNYAINPRYDWGFLLGLGYVFPGTANDVKLDWMYFHNNYNDSEYILGVGQLANLVPAFTTLIPDDSALTASAQMDYKFDAVDLTFGQYLNFGSRLQTRLFTGLRYMQLDADLSTTYAQNTVITPPAVTTLDVFGEVNSSFNGIGPMVGIKADFYIGSGFGLSGAFDSALLVGRLSLNADAASMVSIAPPSVLDAVTNSTYAFETQSVVAPGFDAKFGLNYKYQCNNGTMLGLELGYQVTKYLDVVGETDGNDIPFVPEPSRNGINVTNFRLAGPYLTMNVKV